MERVLSNIDANDGVAFCAVVAGIACSLSGTPAQLSCLRRRRHTAMFDIGPLLGVKETYADVGRLRFFWRRAGSRAETMPSMPVSSSVSFVRRYQCGFAHRDAPVISGGRNRPASRSSLAVPMPSPFRCGRDPSTTLISSKCRKAAASRHPRSCHRSTRDGGAGAAGGARFSALALTLAGTPSHTDDAPSPTIVSTSGAVIRTSQYISSIGRIPS